LDAAMTTNLIEWTVRMVMLVLAGLVTLAILGSIAAMPTDGGPAAGGFVVGRAAPPPRPEGQAGADSNRAGSETPPESGDRPNGEITPVRGVGTTAAAAGEPSQRWLEAIAYALLALAGLLAIAIVLLWRGLHHVRRIADAAEGRPPND